jgi:alpha-L-arabinofuranosidase
LYYEDLCTTPKIYYYARKIKYIPGTFYNYLWQRNEQKNSSISFTVSEKNLNDHFKVFNILRDFLYSNDCFINYKESFYNQVYNSINLHLTNASKTLNKEDFQNYVSLFLKEWINWYVEDSKDKDRIYSKIKNQKKKTRIKFLLVQLSKELGVYKILKRIYPS